MRSFVVVALACTACAPAPARAPADDTEDIALLWSARLPGAVEGPVVLERRDVAYADIPRCHGEDAADIDGLALLGGALLLRRMEVLGTEQLVVTAPPSRWVATSGALHGPVPRRRDAKLEVVLDLEPGGSSAVMFHVEGGLVDEQLAARGAPPARRVGPTQLAMIGLDVVWPAASEVPTLTTTVARVDRAREAVPE